MASIKEYDSYFSKIQEKYPDLTKEKLKEILKYGFGKMIKIQGSFGMFAFYDKNKMFSFGQKRDEEASKMKVKKFRRIYELKKKPFENIYYVIIRQNEANLFKAFLNKQNLQFINFKNKIGYRVWEEALYKAFPGDSIYSVYYPVDMGNAYSFNCLIPKEHFKFIKRK